VGTEEVTRQPAFYGRTGSLIGDLLTVLHLPYTAWHLSYVVIGAGVAPTVDWWRLAGTLAAFASGLGVGAHAIDEVYDRPLGTSLSDATLWVLGLGGLIVAAGIGVAGAFVISPWILAWAGAGIALSLAYSLEWSPQIHSDAGFALAWGAFPVLVGYWAQAETLAAPALIAALAAAALSAAQRSLSTAARKIRRHPGGAPVDNDELAGWETPLRYLSLAVPLIALAILATHL
jgi:hypothetical protein